MPESEFLAPDSWRKVNVTKCWDLEPGASAGRKQKCIKSVIYGEHSALW